MCENDNWNRHQVTTAVAQALERISAKLSVGLRLHTLLNHFSRVAICFWRFDEYIYVHRIERIHRYSSNFGHLFQIRKCMENR